MANTRIMYVLRLALVEEYLHDSSITCGLLGGGAQDDKMYSFVFLAHVQKMHTGLYELIFNHE